MRLRERVKKERTVWPIIMRGYSRGTAASWYGAMNYDRRKYSGKYTKETREQLYADGYLCRSATKYGDRVREYISDFDYLAMSPFNNSFSKWLDDILTTGRVLKNHRDHNREVYFSIVQRNRKQMILRTEQEDREYTVEDLLDFVRAGRKAELRPAYWSSTGSRYRMEYRDGYLYLNDEVTDEKAFRRIVRALKVNYVLCEAVEQYYAFSEDFGSDHALKFWIANDQSEEPVILESTIGLYWTDEESELRKNRILPVDVEHGTFTMDEKTVQITDWEGIKAELCAVSRSVGQISYYTASIMLQKDRPFKFVSFSTSPRLPDVAFGETLNDYLKARAAKRVKRSFGSRIKGLKSLMFAKLVKKFCRRGIRPYMQQLWLEAVKSDFLHTKDVSLPKKIWAWKHGFVSYHTYQYNMTKENYKQFLSDYDYYWLNRINNAYQKWINDKTTYRLTMEPFKEYVPKYYYSCLKRDGLVKFFPMWDCPEGFKGTFHGMLELLKQEGKLALKPSAGTHGDGFYCLSYEEETFRVNGEDYSEDRLYELFDSLKSFYVITEYLEMHQELKKIYAKSVNTVRMMVVNRNGYDPKIMQTYMRIGSSRTGYTDNVGYGGICVMVNSETGELYQPQTIKDHIFYDCPTHPDTGTPISGILPNWDLVCNKVLEICRYLCELEYLGFDVAITDEGFCILEINIHQDLHKVNLFSDEVMEFFNDKIARKRRAYGYRT